MMSGVTEAFMAYLLPMLFILCVFGGRVYVGKVSIGEGRTA